MLATNTILQGRYRITRQLSRGGMGAVYEAVDERVSTIVALKETFADNQIGREAFEREAKLLANLEHPGFPRVMDHFVEGEGQFLVMQFIKGDDLAARLATQSRPFGVPQVLAWADQLLDALEDLHTYEPPIIHRDIKPSNLKLNRKGRIILLDFGIAKGALGQMSTLETDGSLGGYTPNYAPPEQILRSDRRWVETLSIVNAEAINTLLEKGTDPRSDLYSLGATLYHLMTNEVPSIALTRALSIWSGKPDPLRSANEVNSQIPIEVAAVLTQSMALDRNERPAGAAEMRAALRGAMAGRDATFNQSLSALELAIEQTESQTIHRHVQPVIDTTQLGPAATTSNDNLELPPTIAAGNQRAHAPIRTIKGAFASASAPSPLIDQLHEPDTLVIGTKTAKPKWKLIAGGSVGFAILALIIVLVAIKFSSRPLPARLTISNGGRGVFELQYSPDGRILALGNEATIELRNAETGVLLRTLQASRAGQFGDARIRSIAFSPDGKWLSHSAPDGELRIWELSSGRPFDLKDPINREFKGVEVVCFSPDGKTLATGGSGGVNLWDIETSKLRVSLQITNNFIFALAFSPDGKTLAVGKDATIEIREVESGNVIRSLSAKTQLVTSLAFSPDGSLLASGSRDKGVCWWNVQSGELRESLTGSPEVGKIAFSSDGKLVGGVIGSNVRLWDVSTATLKLELMISGLDGPVRAVAFSPDGRTLATGGKVDTGDNKNAKGEVRLWDLDRLL